MGEICLSVQNRGREGGKKKSQEGARNKSYTRIRMYSTFVSQKMHKNLRLLIHWSDSLLSTFMPQRAQDDRCSPPSLFYSHNTPVRQVRLKVIGLRPPIQVHGKVMT